MLSDESFTCVFIAVAHRLMNRYGKDNIKGEITHATGVNLENILSSERN